MMGRFSASLYVGSKTEYLFEGADEEADLLTVVLILKGWNGC